MSTQRTYIAIDLKSFYASVECVERGLDPLTTNLVVADTSRTDKTICLAVSPSMKAYGIGGRARLFEVVQRMREVNKERQFYAPKYKFTGKSFNDIELKAHPELAVDYIAAPPRMAFYIDYSTRIYKVYLRYFSHEDIHAYSIDEVFIDVTNYLDNYKMTAHQLTIKVIQEVLRETGITATAGIGTNLYLAKIAMDIVAKHIPADKDGVRIAELDEMSYRQKLWDHRPLTDFWRIGHGIARRLERNGLYTMGMVARCSVKNEELLYKLFGINAELIIDHAWGWEPCTIDLIKAYRPDNNSLSNSQVLQSPYTSAKARIVTQEMADAMALKLLERQLTTTQIGLASSIRLPFATSSASHIINATLQLFDTIAVPGLLIRRITIAAFNVVPENLLDNAQNSGSTAQQLDLFTDYEEYEKQKKKQVDTLKKERKMQEAVLEIKHRFGKNAILKGLNFEEGATAKDRNRQIGGHKA